MTPLGRRHGTNEMYCRQEADRLDAGRRGTLTLLASIDETTGTAA